MNFKLSGKTGFYSCKTLKLEIYYFRLFFLTFWECIHLPNFITLSNLLSNLSPLSSLSLSNCSSLFVRWYIHIYIYVCPYACYNVSIFILSILSILKKRMRYGYRVVTWQYRHQLVRDYESLKWKGLKFVQMKSFSKGR